MKGGLASMMMTMKALARVGGPPRGKVIFLATPDEEYSSGANIRYLFSKGKISGDFAVVGEFSGVGNVFIGMKGGIWGDLRIKGKAAHGSQPLKGINALEKLVGVMVEIEERFKPGLLTKKSSYKFIPPEYDSPTAMIGGIVRASNVARSTVPDMITTSFDLRTIPEDHDHRMVDDFRNFLVSLKETIPDLDLEVEVASQFPTYALPEDSRLVQCLKGAITHLTGTVPSLSISCAATEAAFFAQKGIPAVAYGPGAWQAAHAKDESVLIEDLEMASLVYAQVALLLLSGG
jgi:succinyl-diaminopimelate desuccinylase